MAFVGILSQIKLLFGPLVIQLVWYILKQSFTSVSVKVVVIYLHFGAKQLLIIQSKATFRQTVYEYLTNHLYT